MTRLRRRMAWWGPPGWGAVAALAWLGVFTPSGAIAQVADTTVRTSITQMADLIRRNYLFEGPADAMAARLMERLDAGAYFGLSGPELAELLTKDLYAASRDRHMYVLWDPESVRAATSGGAAQTAANPGRVVDSAELNRQRAEAENFGIAEMRWLPEKVGYLRITTFQPLQISQGVYDAALKYLKHADAMIFDVRGNGGGAPGPIRFLQSHFHERSENLLRFTSRATGQSFDQPVTARTDGYWQGIPVYILIDGLAASAGEDFPFTSKHAGEAILVGERTAGAGHMNRLYPIEPGFSLSIASAGPVSPVTGGNWEGTGVEPDITVPSPQALAVAYRDALRQLSRGADEATRRRLAWRSQSADASVNDVAAADPELSAFEGTFGDRRVEVVGRTLRITQEGRAAYFERVGGTLFAQLYRDPPTVLSFRMIDGRAVGVSEVEAPIETSAVVPRADDGERASPTRVPPALPTPDPTAGGAGDPALTEFAGEYDSASIGGGTAVVTIWAEGSTLLHKHAAYNPSRFRRAEGDRFVEVEEGWQLIFRRGESGEVVGYTALLSDGRESTATKRKQAPAPRALVPDAALAAAIRSALDLGVAPIQRADLERLTRLRAVGLGIVDLTGLEYASNLRQLVLGANQIANLGPLARLTDLRELHAWNNKISDLQPLRTLTKLEQLQLGANRVEDLSPLRGLTALTRLDLAANSVSDLGPLISLRSLKSLDLSGNPTSPPGNDVIRDLRSRGVTVITESQPLPAKAEVACAQLAGC